MKNKLTKTLVCLLCITFLLGTLPSLAGSIDKPKDLKDSALNYKLAESGDEDIQGFINGYLTENAGTLSEWYIFGLSKSGDYDFSSYEKALLSYLENNEAHSATTRQKYALALISVGSNNEYINTTLNEATGKLGIMSLVYGLHILNNGYTSDSHTADSIINEILSLTLEDSGWALTGNVADIDVTAMTIQALTPHYKENEAVKAAIDNALNLLSKRQNEDGSFSSYGASNAESTAQVIAALSGLGIDSASDNRFIKNGKNLFDALAIFKLQNGGFSHSVGSSYSENATSQIFHAMTAYSAMKENLTPPYIFENNHKLENAEEESSAKTENPKLNYKFFISIGAVILALIAVVILLFTKRVTKQNLLLILSAAAIVIFAVNFINITSTEEHYSADKSKETIGTVSVTVRCDSILGKENAGHKIENAVIIQKAEVPISENDTVFTVLETVAKENKILIESSSASGSLYVRGIANIYEFDFGALSGWVYTVNGETSSLACDEYTLSDGDAVEWNYTLEPLVIE